MAVMESMGPVQDSALSLEVESSGINMIFIRLGPGGSEPSLFLSQ